jgi:hypothetical protein
VVERSSSLIAISLFASLCPAVLATQTTYTSLEIPQDTSVQIGATFANLFLAMQGDGNLVLYQSGAPVWNTRTAGQNCSSNQCFAVFQGDGNFVVYNGSTPLWSSITGGHPGAQLVLSTQAPHLKIVGAGGSILWANSNHTLADFDGDHRTDISLFRCSNGIWYLQQSTAGYTQVGLGQCGDIAVPGDYDGDGKTDIGVFRASIGTWFLQQSSAGYAQIGFGQDGDVPVPGDYDGDGQTDIAVFRASVGTWFLRQSSAGYAQVGFGQSGDVPVPADYDGDGKTDVAVFRPSTGTWYVQGTSAGYYQVGFGQVGDVPVPGDYDGDGKTDIAVFRPSNGIWYVQGTSAGYYQFGFGQAGDVPVPGDYDGDGKTDIAVFRASIGTWLLQQSSAGFAQVGFGGYGDVPAPAAIFTYAFAASAPPSVQISNITHPNLSPNFEVGDTLQVIVLGPPNQAVNMTQTPGTTTQAGQTDANGIFVFSAVEQTTDIGTYTQVWSVGPVQASPALSFIVGQLGATGTVSTTDIGQTSDGSITAISSLSVTNGTVSTYSATELDYTASLYYDAQTVGTLYQDGTAILQGVSQATAGGAAGGLSASAVAWDDYDLQTDHYVVAFFVSGSYFENPLYLGDGSCDDASSDCTIGLGGGVYWLEAASIYLGSTAADQVDVTQDASNIPLADDSAYNSFFQEIGQPTSGITFKIDLWTSAIRSIIPALFIAESAYQSQNQSYPLPLFLQLVQDGYNETTPPVERSRTYLIRDIYGKVWNFKDPLRIDEMLTYVAGSGQMPQPNENGWTSANGEIDSSSEMTDLYQNRAVFGGYPEVDFLHQYYATGFKAPELTLPGVPTLGPVQNAIPLMILSPNPNILGACRYFGTLGVALRADYVGINGDRGPNGTCLW